MASQTEYARRVDQLVETEQSLLGACLMSSQAWLDTWTMLAPGDFYKPAHQHIWDAMVQLHRTGTRFDALLISNHLSQAGLLDQIGGSPYLMELQQGTPAISNAVRYARLVKDDATLRGTAMVMSRIADDALAGGSDPFAVIREGEEHLAAIRESYASAALRVTTPAWADWMHEPFVKPDWLVPRFLARGHRGIVAATAGAGKSSFLRQIAAFCASGFDPFVGDGTQGHATPLARPLTTLVVDRESEKEGWKFETRPMFDWLRQRSAGEFYPPLFVHTTPAHYAPQSNRLHERDLVARIEDVRPDLLIYGPIYKDERSDDKSWGAAAGDLQDLLHGLVKTYNFGLLMEHHMGRQDRLRGAQDWEFWPEWVIQLGARRTDSTTIGIKHLRGIRYAQMYQWFPRCFTQGPQHMKFAQAQGLSGTWPDGTFHQLSNGSMPWDFDQSNLIPPEEF